MDELVVFFMREFGWTYEYARDLVLKLPIQTLRALIAETQYQRAMENYKQASYSAMIVVALISDKRHKRTVSDIIGNPPTRGGGTVTRGLERAAQKEGIILPKEETHG